MLVEVKLNDAVAQSSAPIEQLKQLMAFMNCSIGLLVSGERVVLLRDSLEQANGESIRVVGEATLPYSLLPPVDNQWKGRSEVEYESQIQKWLEDLKSVSGVRNLPADLREIFNESIISILQLGEVRAAGPRWSKAAT